MLPNILCVVAAGFICGLLLMHWLALTFVCAAASIALILVSPWDWLLVPKWFGLLTTFEFAYLAGVVVKVLSDDAQLREGGDPAGRDQESGRRQGLPWQNGRGRGARHEPRARA